MQRDVAHTLDFARQWLPRDARVLEIGCGDGALAAELSREFRVIAIDEDAALIDVARSRGVDAQVARWPDFDGELDAILFTRSLHHVGDLEAAIVRARELLEWRAAALSGPLAVRHKGPPRAAALHLLVEDFAWHETDPRLMAIGNAPAEHDEHLHSWSAMRETIGRHFSIEHEEDTPYLFRWGDDALFDEERRVARQLGVPMLGRRIVATLRA